MPNFNQDDAIQQIINNCRKDFTLDCSQRMGQIQESLHQWKQSDLTDQSLVQIIHKHVHIIVGVALSLQFTEIHHSCTEILKLVQEISVDFPASDHIIRLIEHIQQLKEIIESGDLK